MDSSKQKDEEGGCAEGSGRRSSSRASQSGHVMQKPSWLQMAAPRFVLMAGPKRSRDHEQQHGGAEQMRRRSVRARRACEVVAARMKSVFRVDEELRVLSDEQRALLITDLEACLAKLDAGRRRLESQGSAADGDSIAQLESVSEEVRRSIEFVRRSEVVYKSDVDLTGLSENVCDALTARI